MKPMSNTLHDQVHTIVRKVLKGVATGIFMQSSDEPITRGLDKLSGIALLASSVTEGEDRAECKDIVTAAKRLLNNALENGVDKSARVKARKCLMENFL
jgi:hypothetical protein